MTEKSERIMVQALSLPEHERAAIAESLISSLDEPNDGLDVEQAWQEEVSRRLAEIDRGEVACIPWEEARRRLRERLGGSG